MRTLMMPSGLVATRATMAPSAPAPSAPATMNIAAALGDQAQFSIPRSMFTMRRVGEVGVAALTCPRVSDGEASAIASHLREASYLLQGRMVLDMSGVSRFTCAWINAMIDISRRCASMGGKLVVAGLRREHRTMLRSFGLLKHLTIARDQHAALALHGVRTLSPWRLAIARLLELPVPTAAAPTPIAAPPIALAA